VWIRERLDSAGVGQSFVDLSDHVAESGFVATRRDGKMESAVTSSAIAHHTFRKDRIDAAVAAARLVVLDCNLTVEQLSLFVDAAQRAERPVIVTAVSDSKVRRIAQLAPAKPLDLVSMNELEATAAGIVDIEHADHEAVALACDALHAANVLVTRGARGHVVLRSSGQRESFAAPEVETVVSPTGAGDALVAGVAAHWFRHGRLDLQQAQPTIGMLVRKVLEQPGATAGSLAVDADFAKLARIAIREGPWLQRFLTQEVGVAAAVVALLVGVVQVWYAQRADEYSRNAARAERGARALETMAPAAVPAATPASAPAVVR
jgi:sugar/nucleoside kinase (ribokinase family)